MFLDIFYIHLFLLCLLLRDNISIGDLNNFFDRTCKFSHVLCFSHERCSEHSAVLIVGVLDERFDELRANRGDALSEIGEISNIRNIIIVIRCG